MHQGTVAVTIPFQKTQEIWNSADTLLAEEICRLEFSNRLHRNFGIPDATLSRSRPVCEVSGTTDVFLRRRLMHMHSVAASAAGNSLAGAALAAESALATRRAQELREAGRKLKAASLESGLQFADQLQADPQSAALGVVGAVADGNSGANQSALASQESFAQRFTSDIQLQQAPAQVQEVQATSSAAPVSYWA